MMPKICVVKNSEKNLFGDLVYSFKTAVTTFLLPISIIGIYGNPYYFLISYQLKKEKCSIFNNLKDTAHPKDSTFESI